MEGRAGSHEGVQASPRGGRATACGSILYMSGDRKRRNEPLVDKETYVPRNGVLALGFAA
jgi:hypothetical protein